MDSQAAGAQALGAAKPPRGPPLPSSWAAPPSPGVGFAMTDHSDLKESETEKATARLARGAQSIPNESAVHGEGVPSEEEGFALDDEDSDGELNTWELPEGVSGCLPKEQTADLFNEDWDLELKTDQGNPYDADDIQGSISQEVKPWVCCVPQGDIVYDPSWHHPPPLIPHYSKMVFEKGQFDDAED
ncbi:coordinator of PRMT5 and differentiation stimulator [Orycteropus afer afer]|uniref:Coordinator of PRMT5 and differentiation stimulator n=1 Tax=Orycteropus afer afer TaxID=1230840 RepID=A0A8B6ZNG1_ORYAF|nr:coordinator of PRMT5 and differentiation stimulator [Orycteropus afer afer]